MPQPLAPNPPRTTGPAGRLRLPPPVPPRRLLRGPGPGVRGAYALLCATLLGVATLGAPPARAQFNGDFSIEKHTLDEENFLDWKAYQHPFPWRYDLYTAPNYFRGTVGSLSQKQFYFFEQIRLEKDLGKYGTVLYFEEEDSFFRAEPIYREVELRLGRGVYASVLGFPRAEKINGHQGYALAYGERTDWTWLRVTHLDQFRLFNQENTGAARFDVEPELNRLDARAFPGERVFFQVELRDERPTVLRTPSDDSAESRREFYEGRKGEAVLDVHWSADVVTGLHVRRQIEKRRREPFGVSTVTPARQTLELTWADLYAAVTLAGGSVIEAGVYHGAFRNDIAADAPAERFDHHLLTDAAYGVWTYPYSDWWQWVFSFQAGEADLVERDGALPPTSHVDERSGQLKAGVGFVMQEAESYRFLFNTTWDLDIIDQRQWDGGNVQLIFLF